MIISNTTYTELKTAMGETNKKFDKNIIFKTCTSLNNKDSRWSVTLTVIDSNGKGSRRGFQRRRDGERRRLSAACWHVHGFFMDSLNKAAVIRSAGHVVRPGDNWNDWTAGSIFEPCMMSELCDCE